LRRVPRTKTKDIAIASTPDQPGNGSPARYGYRYWLQAVRNQDALADLKAGQLDIVKSDD
jgi:hypothetical protein